MNALRGIFGRTFAYSDEDHLLTAGDVTYQYDVDGFLTTKAQGSNIARYNYSSRGELLSANLPDGRMIEYINDPLGRRIARKVNGTVTEKYLWQGLTHLLAVYDNSNNLVMRFEYADGRMPVAMARDGATYYLAYDQVGSLKVVTDASGNVVKRIDYDSFGNIINETNLGFEIPFGFAGGLHDRDIGLVRFGFRDYDPDMGRWTAKDPILFNGGDIDSYGCVTNNPINRIDPRGLQQVIPWGSPWWVAVPIALPVISPVALPIIIGGAIVLYPSEIAEDSTVETVGEPWQPDQVNPCPQGTPEDFIRLCIGACRSKYSNNFFKRVICEIGCILAAF